MRCINADHLIGLVKDATILGDGFKQAFIAIVRGEPTIEPERKKGKWIDKGWNGDWQYQTDGRGMSWHEWQCSECNHITKGAKWHFCPNCGANMKEGEQDA